MKSKKIDIEFNLKSKEDFLNFSIENVWKEMEEINRSKQAAQDLFKVFQDDFYDRSKPCFHNQDDYSPTKRLVQMKNTTAKHHTNEEYKNLKEGKYSLQYTTCPQKSHVVVPDEGEINYDKCTGKNAHKFVEKIINAEVDLYEIQEKPLKKKKTMAAPKAKKQLTMAETLKKSPSVTSAIKKKKTRAQPMSPVKISHDHLPRSHMVSQYY